MLDETEPVPDHYCDGMSLLRTKIAEAEQTIAAQKAEIEVMREVVEAAREAVGYNTDGSAAFQPECEGYAEDISKALAKLSAIKETK